jgi:hypothetical protein
MSNVTKQATDPLNPSTGVLVKLGSALRHADEAMSENGHAADEGAFRALLADPEVSTWLSEMDAMAFLPVKRDA